MEFVGRSVRKELLGFGVTLGTVKSYNSQTGLFEIIYENGGSEELEPHQVASILEEDQSAAASAAELPAELMDTILRTPKRRRDKYSGNACDNLVCSSSSSVAAESKTLEAKILLDVDVNYDDHVIDLDLNVPLDDGELFNRGKLKRGEKLIDLNVNVVSEDDESESKPKKEHCFDLNIGIDDEMKDSVGHDTLVKGFDGSSASKSTGAVDTSANFVNESGSEMVGPSNMGTMTVNAYEVNVGSASKGNSKKRRRVSEFADSATKTVLRRSARKGRADISVRENVPGASSLVAVKEELFSPMFSVVSEEKDGVVGCEESEGHNILPSKPQLPPSSENLDLDGIPIFDLFSVYSFLRSFSTLLFLSPFELDDFVAALRCKAPTLLFDYIHVSLLQTLRKHLESIPDESSESASICLRSLNWNFLDLITWPIFMVEYLLMHSSLLSPGFDICRLKLFESDYYKQPEFVKIEMLRCLCDGVNEVEIIRSELNRRTLAIDPSMDYDRKAVFETTKKGRAVMDASGTSCLTSEVVEETTDWNSDECFLCKMDGSLICCDGCPAAYHSRCVGVATSVLPEGDWYCPECTIDKNNPWMRVGTSIRGGELLGIDPYGRLYYSSCGYLLVSDSGDKESPVRYYHRNDLTVVVEAIKSTHIFYSTLLGAIMKFWNVSFIVKSENGKPEEKSIVSTCSGNVGPGISEPVIVDDLMKMGNPVASSEGSAEVSQVITGIHNLQSTRTSKSSSGSSNDIHIPEKSTILEVELQKKIQLAHMPSQRGVNYMNFYSFARTASSAVDVLLRKSADKISDDTRKSVEEIISAQLKVLTNISTEFCWSNIQNLDVDARKEKCGWCFSCKTPKDGGDCLFILKDTAPFLKNFTSESLGIEPRNKWKGHLIDVMCHILCIEDRLHGLLLGPWLNSDYSKTWRKAVYEASDVASLKDFLIMLESNLHTRALSAEWHKLVDSATTVGSASHVVTSSPRMSSKRGASQKRARCRDIVPNPSSNAAGTGLGLFWWRGGRISRELFKWKVLPRSLASKAARQAGSKKIPGIIYSESSEYAKRTKCVAWRASVEASSSVEQLALQVRELDANIKWDAIENPKLLSKMDKEFRKSIRSFKKVIIRRKCSEGTVAKYLLDFGKRRFIPDVVVIHGSMVEESSSSGRKKYWLEESYVPLHLFKAFEEKRIARAIKKTSSKKPQESGIVLKKFPKERGFSYLFSKTERSEIYQCGHCKKEVLSREAVSCQYCEGYFHKRHTRKSAGAISAESTYTSHKCQQDQTCMKIDNRGNLQKGKDSVATGNKAKPKLLSKSGTRAGKYKQLKKCQTNKKQSVVVPLRRSSRKVKMMPRQMEFIESLKKGKKTKSKKGNSKKPVKPKNPESPSTWQKKKRTLISHSYWLNGLRLSRKLNDEKLSQFRSEKLIVASAQLNSMFDKPKCSLCCEAEFTSTLNYIGCEICGDWFHGDAFGLAAAKIGYLIGFKCHKCRNRAPPLCPRMHASN